MDYREADSTSFYFVCQAEGLNIFDFACRAVDSNTSTRFTAQGTQTASILFASKQTRTLSTLFVAQWTQTAFTLFFVCLPRSGHKRLLFCLLGSGIEQVLFCLPRSGPDQLPLCLLHRGLKQLLFGSQRSELKQFLFRLPRIYFVYRCGLKPTPFLPLNNFYFVCRSGLKQLLLCLPRCRPNLFHFYCSGFKQLLLCLRAAGQTYSIFTAADSNSFYFVWRQRTQIAHNLHPLFVFRAEPQSGSNSSILFAAHRTQTTSILLAAQRNQKTSILFERSSFVSFTAQMIQTASIMVADRLCFICETASLWLAAKTASVPFSAKHVRTDFVCREAGFNQFYFFCGFGRFGFVCRAATQTLKDRFDFVRNSAAQTDASLPALRAQISSKNGSNRSYSVNTGILCRRWDRMGVGECADGFLSLSLCGPVCGYAFEIPPPPPPSS